MPFRETAVKAPDMAPPKTKDAPRGTIHGSLVNGLVTYTIRAMPLPETITDFLLANTSTIANMSTQKEQQQDDTTTNLDEDRDASDGTTQARLLTSEQFWTELEALFAKAGPEWAGAAERIWTFGPKRIGANLLLDPVGSTKLRLRGKERLMEDAQAKGQSTDQALAAADDAVAQDQMAALSTEDKTELRLLRDFENSIEAGFQMATFQGPLCAEPVVGMAWVVERVTLNKDAENDAEGKSFRPSLLS